MNVDCPYCQSSAVCESTDTKANELIDELSKLAVVSRAVRELYQSLDVHPLIKVLLGVTLIVAVQYLKSSRGSLPLAQKPYRCEDCNKVFTVFYPFV